MFVIDQENNTDFVRTELLIIFDITIYKLYERKKIIPPTKDLHRMLFIYRLLINTSLKVPQHHLPMMPMIRNVFN